MMHIPILLTFTAVLGVSLVGATTISDHGSASGGIKWPDEIEFLDSIVNNDYGSMRSRKMWRELMKKGKKLETTKLQLQHLLNLRQEKLNKLNGMPMSHNVPVPATGKIAEINRGIEKILAFIKDFYLHNNKFHLADENDFSYNRDNIKSNSPLGRHEEIGYSYPNEPHEVPSQIGLTSSFIQGLTPEFQSGGYPPVGKSAYELGMNHQTSGTNRPYDGSSPGSSTSSSSNQSSKPQVQSGVNPLVAGSTYEPRMSYQTSVPNQPHGGSSQVGAFGSSSNQELKTQVQSGVNPLVAGSTYEPRMSYQTSVPNQPHGGSSQVGAFGSSSNQGLKTQIQSGVHRPVKEVTNAQPAVIHQSQERVHRRPQGIFNKQDHLDFYGYADKSQALAYMPTHNRINIHNEYSTPLVIY